MHSPKHAKEAAEARRLGGLRRGRESTLAGIYDLEGLSELELMRRLLKIAVLDTLSLENSVNRNRTIAYLIQVRLKVHQASDFESRLQTVEEKVTGLAQEVESIYGDRR